MKGAILIVIALCVVSVDAKHRHRQAVSPAQLEAYCRGAGAGAAICPKYQPPCLDITDKTRDNGPTRPINVKCGR